MAVNTKGGYVPQPALSPKDPEYWARRQNPLNKQTPAIAGGSASPAPSTQNSDASREAAQAAAILAEYGLDELIPIVDQWIRGGLTIDEAMLQLRDPKSDAGRIFDARFPAIQLRRKAGVAPISPAEYVAYERARTQLFQSAGMPIGFYDDLSDVTQDLVDDKSISELTERVNNGFAKVNNAPPEIRSAFTEFFGPNGDSALAAFFLDKGKAVPILAKLVQDAEVGGAGKQLGFHVDQAKARKIADTGVGYDQARSGFSVLSDLQPVFSETISEATDLTAEGEGVDAVFGLDQGQAKKQVAGRLGERTAAMSGVGGAAASERGVSGLGSAKR